MARDEFIEEHWEEALVIDSKMREAAVACVKNFLGKEQEVGSLLTRDLGAEYETAADLYIDLSYRYSLKALDQRFVKSRPYVEMLFQLCILQASLGDDAVIIVACQDPTTITLKKAFQSQNATGKDRYQVGTESLRLVYDNLGRLLISPSEIHDTRKNIAKKALKSLWAMLWRKKRSDQEKADAKEKQSEGIQRCIKQICEDWGIDCLPELDFDGWMFEKFPTEESKTI